MRETRLESGETTSLVGESSKGRGAEQLKALNPMVVKQAEGGVSWIAEEDLRVRGECEEGVQNGP